MDTIFCKPVVKPYSGNTCLFVMTYLLLSQPMTSFMIVHAFLRILCLLLSDHIQNINLSRAINYQLIVIVISSLLEFHSCGINCTPQLPISFPFKKVFVHCYHSSCNTWLVSVFCSLIFVVILFLLRCYFILIIIVCFVICLFCYCIAY